MTSAIDICNRALEQVGADTIVGFDTSPDSDDKATRVTRRLYPQLRDALLRDHLWPFARTRVTLPALATPPAWGYAFQYQLPGDCLRVNRLQCTYAAGLNTVSYASAISSDHASYDDWPGPAFEVDGRTLLTDAAAPLAVLYTRQVTDAGTMDALFVNALVLAMAAQLAMPFTKDAELAQELDQRAERAMTRARAAANLEGGDHTRLSNRALAVRR